MRTDTFFLFGSFLFSLLVITVSKPKTISSSEYSEKAISHVNKIFQEDLKNFQNETTTFYETAEQFSNNYISEKQLQKKYRNLRDAFKKTELFLEYLDKEAYDKLINGAPLPKLEEKVSDLRILEPKGLQVIDEIMGDLSVENSPELVEQCKKLQHSVSQTTKFIGKQIVSDRQFFEASRQAVVRLTTLGITGFDTPGTLQGITDTHIVLQTLQHYFSYYKSELKNIGETNLLNEIDTQYKQGIKLTNQNNFNEFDRLTFIKTIANPLFKTIKDIHLALDYETIYEVARYNPSVNYYAENMFAKDFLDPFYYVSLPNDSLYNDRAELGRLLFYDPVLSNNNKLACATCHNPQKGFTDGMKKSLSNVGNPLQRNAMTLNYSVFASGYFHDLRAKRLEDQFEHVVMSKDEFNSNYQNIIEKLNSSKGYSEKFETAFPAQNQPIKPNNIDYALTAYVMQLNTFDSAIDQFFQNKTNNLPENVKRGFNLFAGKAACATCHFIPTFAGNAPPLFKDSESEILGVPKDKNNPSKVDNDLGRVGNGMTQEVAPFYEFSFKTTTLRNIAKTAPYMHNGVFDTLEEVMDFYNDGGGAGRGIVLENQTLSPEPLHLTEDEIQDVIAFMNALSDGIQFTAPEELPRDFSNEKINERELLK